MITNLHNLRQDVSAALVMAARKWRRASQGALTSYGVSEACATPLIIAGRLGQAVHQVTLAEYVGIEGPSLVRLLDQLCASGLVRRTADPMDRRAKTISLTEEGRSMTERIEADLCELRAHTLKGVSRSDLEITLRVLKAFNAPGDSAGRPILDV